ncbi:olfactory receptor 52R1-like [Pelodiscus sinensis]|uniref:olfactory receptor 52R1-like n=1 Tax=Pelodiscus sinensis TaxID=13735 RepID=UPI0003C47073|nr:olfactory receptor 52R1-like [Pelodiscus sinensis]|eukprot:XP_006114680.1 olfactory receptor 52R1-like [Pelodiscus sinensis]
MPSIFWFNSREIYFSSCLTLLCVSVIESGIFVAMVFDPYVVICHPLRHSTILTNPIVVRIVFCMVLHATLLTLPFPYLAGHWLYCRTNIIPEPFCEHIAMMSVACGDTHANSYYGLFVVFMVNGLDVILITMSYIQILRAIFRLPTKDNQLKTFETCTSHLCPIVAFYIPGLFLSLLHRFVQNVPLHFHVLLTNL